MVLTCLLSARESSTAATVAALNDTLGRFAGTYSFHNLTCDRVRREHVVMKAGEDSRDIADWSFGPSLRRTLCVHRRSRLCCMAA